MIRKKSKKERGLPIGYWKGSAFSIVLDMLATLLSAGNSTYRIGLSEYETAISQVYLCICPEIFPDKELQHSLINEIIDYTHNITPLYPNHFDLGIEEGGRTYYPGEQSANANEQNTKHGMKVNEEIWQNILSLLKE
ncbi:MAG: Ldh family oxidoreductase [Lewinella sp.]